MQVKVKKSSDILYWYADKINQVFTVYKAEKDETGVYYWVRTGDAWNTLNFIKDTDCELQDDISDTMIG